MSTDYKVVRAIPPHSGQHFNCAHLWCFDIEGPGWSPAFCWCEATEDAGEAFCNQLQVIFDCGGVAAVKQFIEDGKERERLERLGMTAQEWDEYQRNW